MDMLNDMDEKAIKIIELSSQLGADQPVVDKLNKELTQRQIQCETWINRVCTIGHQNSRLFLCSGNTSEIYRINEVFLMTL